ncbi:helix-turn-helix domain-containing protein [Methylomonas methanica]|uniref:Helix-turn-helix domain protein n=1 Tax=Methylomonas methanica (strain DSM 25384 / MC09) TaxID=857087 RepID=G0A221_METMM|nr:helix-turn-helix transcriptional regulator [Methylomonas methanica]AEG02564.1 helix-turn-helix domain protein [Methylomonas methanica MC09]
MIGERIKLLREFKGLSRRKLEQASGIPEYTWTAVEGGKQKPNEDHIEALAKLWPEFKFWLVFGETMPECGQISPELEEIRVSLKQGTQ